MNKSIATISSPEFINLKPLDINPLMSKCEIKVLYTGENRNQTYISKETATEMAKTLRGAPIVGYYKVEKEDFADHGEVITIDDEGIHFNCMTRPYGFVAPDALVWFQTFEETSEFGEKIIREYLMTNGYLWTEQFKESQSVVEGEGKPQSMELDEDSLKGHWARNTAGIEFFIINDATFSKLCILGEDIEPCFEGASVTALNVSASFTKADNAFKQTLFTMMQDLQAALKGGQSMDDNVIVNTDSTIEPELDNPSIVSSEPVEPVIPAEPAAEPLASVEPTEPEEPVVEPIDPPVEPAEPIAQEPSIEAQFEALKEEHANVVTDYEALQQKFLNLQSDYSALEAKCSDLSTFKKQVIDTKKDEMIEKFYMLSDEDKQDVIMNKDNYSVEDIEEKLSVICFRKKVNFDSLNNNENNNITEPPVVYSYNNLENSEPAWITAVKNTKKNRI